MLFTLEKEISLFSNLNLTAERLDIVLSVKILPYDLIVRGEGWCGVM